VPPKAPASAAAVEQDLRKHRPGTKDIARELVDLSSKAASCASSIGIS
jgi:hypothetical protein